MIYLDNGATSFQKPPSVSAAVQSAMRSCSSPGRGGYAAAMEAAKRIYACRALAGELFGCPIDRVVFAMNATHGLNIAIKTLVKRGGRAVVSGFEHNAVMRPLYHIGAEVNVAGCNLFDRQDTLNAFCDAVHSGVDAVICTHVSNVFGYVLPIEEIAALCRERNVPLIVDASQSAGVLPVSLEKLQADFIAMPGHKSLYGPQGTGILLCGRTPDTLIEGGSGSLSQEPDMPSFLPDRAEAGTANVAGICGLYAGMRFVQQKGVPYILQHEQKLCKMLADGLTNLGLKCFCGAEQTGVLSVTAPMDCELLAARLAECGCAVRAGLHCAPLAHKSAGTLQSGTVRFSPSAFTTAQEIRTTIQLVKKCLKN